MVSCAATASLPRALRAELAAFATGGGYEPMADYRCELEVDHEPFPHHSVGQAAGLHGGRDLWVVWADGVAPNLIEIEPCEAERADESVCILFESHPGAHNFAD